MNILSLFHISSPFLRSNCLDKKEIYEDYICSVCLDVCDVPVITLCNHICCYKCMYYSLLHKRSCPLCKQTIRNNNLRKLFGRKKTEYEALRIKCSLCEKEIRIKDYKKHVNECKYKRCKNYILGCEYYDEKQKIKTHEDMCENILISCSSCSKLFHYKNRILVLDLRERCELRMHNTYTYYSFCYNLLLNHNFLLNPNPNDNNNNNNNNNNSSTSIQDEYLNHSLFKYLRIAGRSNNRMSIPTITMHEESQPSNLMTREYAEVMNGNLYYSNEPIRENELTNELTSETCFISRRNGEPENDTETIIRKQPTEMDSISDLHIREEMSGISNNLNTSMYTIFDQNTQISESDAEFNSSEFLNIFPLTKKFNFKENNAKDVITIIEELFRFDNIDISNIYVENSDFFLCNKSCFADTIKKLRQELEKASSLLYFCCCVGMPVMFTLGGISYVITKSLFRFSILLTSTFLNISYKVFQKIFSS